jgi:hypothetical protein
MALWLARLISINSFIRLLERDFSLLPNWILHIPVVTSIPPALKSVIIYFLFCILYDSQCEHGLFSWKPLIRWYLSWRSVVFSLRYWLDSEIFRRASFSVLAGSVDDRNLERNCRLKMVVFWHVLPCSLVDIDSRFRGAYFFHHQESWWWRQYPPVRRSVFIRRHGATSSLQWQSPWEPEILLQTVACF